MWNELVKLRRDRIVACITCPLCHKLFRNATTLSECLHTFCRKCIYKKLSEEELECCPVCNIDLSGVPLEKLRSDHNLEDVRAKIFPYKRRKVKAPEIMPLVTLPIRRKERSLSSLVVTTPRISVQTGMTGRRSKSVAKKALQGSTFSIDKPIKNEEHSREELESSNSPETLKMFAHNERLNSSKTEPSSCLTPDKETHNCTEQWEGKLNPLNPLNCLAEVENKSKCSRFTSEGSIGKSESLHCDGNDAHVQKIKVKEHGLKFKVQEDKNNRGPAPPESEKIKKFRSIRPKRASNFGDISPQTLRDSISVKCERRTNPIWFSLVASEDQQGDAPLPQISASYLRIKDGNIPVSFIQKYLMRKLDLSSEDEVEIRYMGQLIVPTLQLNNLVDIRLQTTESELVPAIIGSSAKDFLMVLAYARKVPSLQSS